MAQKKLKPLAEGTFLTAKIISKKWQAFLIEYRVDACSRELMNRCSLNDAWEEYDKIITGDFVIEPESLKKEVKI